MRRWEIINEVLGLVKNTGRYLEIGVNAGECMQWVQASEKWGVDPSPHANAAYADVFWRMGSDAFFARHSGSEHLLGFDVVFVDGLHHAEQVQRDVENALQSLSVGGVVLMHDCNPTTEPMQQVPMPADQAYAWTGDCWRVIAELRAARPDLATAVIDTDFGIGVVKPVGKRRLSWRGDIAPGVTWQDLEADRKSLLGLLALTEWRAWFKEAVARSDEDVPDTRAGHT